MGCSPWNTRSWCSRPAAGRRVPRRWALGDDDEPGVVVVQELQPGELRGEPGAARALPLLAGEPHVVARWMAGLARAGTCASGAAGSGLLEYELVAVGVAEHRFGGPRLLHGGLVERSAEGLEPLVIGAEVAASKDQPAQRARWHGVEPGDQAERGAAASRGDLNPADAGHGAVVTHQLEAEDLGVELLGPVLVGDWDRDHGHVAHRHGGYLRFCSRRPARTGPSQPMV